MNIHCTFIHSIENRLLPMDIFIYIFWFVCIHISLGYMSRNIIATSLGMYIFNFTRYYQVVFQSGYTDLQPHEQCMSIPVVLHLCQHLVFSFSFFLSLLFLSFPSSSLPPFLLSFLFQYQYSIYPCG